jgi:hypothetical protein
MLSVRMEIPPRFDVCDVCAIGVQTQKANGWALVWASTTTVSGFSGWSAGHSNRDGLRSGTKVLLPSGLSHLSCPRPWTMYDPPLHHSTTQAPRSHGAERKYYMFGSARHPDKSNRRPPHPYPLNLWSGTAYPMVLSPEEASRDSRHDLFGGIGTESLGSVRVSIRRARGGEVWSAAAHLQVHATANLSNVFASTFEAETEEVACAVS